MACKENETKNRRKECVKVEWCVPKGAVLGTHTHTFDEGVAVSSAVMIPQAASWISTPLVLSPRRVVLNAGLVYADPLQRRVLPNRYGCGLVQHTGNSKPV